MNEKTFKVITGSGILNLVGGIVVLVTGITMGVLLLISGARLLKSKSNVII